MDVTGELLKKKIITIPVQYHRFPRSEEKKPALLDSGLVFEVTEGAASSMGLTPHAGTRAVPVPPGPQSASAGGRVGPPCHLSPTSLRRRFYTFQFQRPRLTEAM